MAYNSGMNEKKPQVDVLRLIRLAALLWIGYLVALAIINLAFPPPARSPSAPTPPPQADYLYYMSQGLIALFCFILTYWRWFQRLLNRWFVPMIIVIITMVPFLVHFLMIRFFPFSPQFSREGPILTLLPFSFVGLLLVAWRYRWQYTLLVILGIAALNLGLLWYFSGPDTQSFQGGIVITLTQTVIFLSVGISISFLISRLGQQQKSLEEANINLKHYSSTLEQLTLSRERNRLARELHDTLAHTLSGLSVQLEALKAYWDVDQTAARSVLEKSMEAAHSGLEETRRALRDLRASPLEDLGLVQSIRKMAEEATVPTGLTLEISVADKLPTFSPDVEQGIYRIAQEAITNVVKHSRAKSLKVALIFNGTNVQLQIHDDGVGFDIEKSLGNDKFGLQGMKERAKLIGADLNIQSKPGIGTSLELVV